MSTSQINNKRIAKNTVLLYFRMLLTMGIGLYTSRIVLATLGASDYGLQNVVGGFVTMLSFLNITMTNGTRRFLTYTLGEHNFEKQKKVFSNALIIHSSIAAAAFLFLETAGLWYVIFKMNIPEGRETAALFAFQFSIVTYVISVVQVPFMSSLMAHEEMGIYAYISIFDALAKLGIVFLLQISGIDKLILFSGLICSVQLINALVYNFYCRWKYEECRWAFKYDKPLFKDMTKFSLWTLIGAFGYTTNGQGVNLILNLFFGTIINAARGIAVHVNTMIVGFSHNFQLAANPQIIKLYAEGNIKGMTDLAIRSARFSGLLLIVIMIPLSLNIDYVLKIWLGEYPALTATFLQIIMFQSIIQSMSGPIVTVTHAAGKLKMPNLTGGVVLVSFLPITYIALKLGGSPSMAFIINVFPTFFVTFFNSYYAQKYTGFSQKRYYLEAYGRVLSVLVISLFCSHYICNYFYFSDWINFIFSVVLSFSISVGAAYYIGIPKSERSSINKMILSKFKH